jgi:hypothetical protein
MTLDITFKSPIFDALLSVNPWARDYWSDRLQMIAAGTWNVNAINQGGNAQTQGWLDSFLASRAAATRTRLLGQPESDHDWNRAVYDIVAPIFRDPVLALTEPGTPLVPIGESSRSVSHADQVQGYFPGQFLADVLLLAQPSLRNTMLDEAVDISARTFPIGPDFFGTRFEKGLTASGAKIGPFAEFSTASFTDATLDNTDFYGPIDWALCKFGNQTSFMAAHFHAWVGFAAADFAGTADFSKVKFDGDAQFAGTVFEGACRLDDARFGGSTTFEYSRFKRVPSLVNTIFVDTVCTVRVGKKAREAISAISRPGQPVYCE